jgi:predicted nucleic acid-binding Zn ribbon protein
MAKKCAWCGSSKPSGSIFDSAYCSKKCEHEAKEARKKK